jgi:UDP-glucose 6-dehydrogenase
MRRIGMMGYGAVGQATQEQLPGCMVYPYDPPKELYWPCPVETFDYVYICVDTLRKGPRDHETLHTCLRYLDDQQYKGVVVIRCTVHPCFVAESSQYRLKLIHHPEFLKQTAGQLSDPVNHHVVGSDDPVVSRDYRYFLVAYWGKHLHEPCPPIFECKMVESIVGKLCQNAALAAKVTLFNAIYQIAAAQEGCSFEAVRKIVTSDPRIGEGHSKVPSPDDGQFGFAGHCIPKDLAALIDIDDLGFFTTLDAINIRLGRHG